MYLTIQGLVLRVTDYNDRDALLTVLSREQGKLTVKARGLRRKNSPLTACCQLLSFSEFTLFEYRGMYTIREGRPIELFAALRRDLAKLSLATYFAQVSALLAQEDLPNPELQSLVLNCLYALCSLPLPEQQIKAVFEIRAMCLAGYSPELSGCCVCGKEYPDRIDLAAGTLCCGNCHTEGKGIRMPLSPAALDAMRYCALCSPKRLFSFQLNPSDLSLLADASEGYLMTQLSQGFSTLDFYKSLSMADHSAI